MCCTSEKTNNEVLENPRLVSVDGRKGTIGATPTVDILEHSFG